MGPTSIYNKGCSQVGELPFYFRLVVHDRGWLRAMGLPFCWLNNTPWSYPRCITDNKQAFIQICVDLMCLSILWSDFRENQQNMHVTLFFLKFMLNYIHSFSGMLLM